jgi:hypothetical protein
VAPDVRSLLVYPYPPPPLPPKPPRRRRRRSIDWTLVGYVVVVGLVISVGLLSAAHSCQGKVSCDDRGGVYIRTYGGYKCVFPNQRPPGTR